MDSKPVILTPQTSQEDLNPGSPGLSNATMVSIPAQQQTQQAKQTHILVPNGDIILKTTGDAPELFQVHSHILNLFSPVLAKELLRIPLTSSKTGDVVITFNQQQTTITPREVIVDVDPVALLLTLQILHHKVRSLPSSKISPLLLNEIAKIAERYELQEPLLVWMEKWADSFFKLDLRTSWEDEYDEIKKWSRVEELARLCSFHWAFGNDNEFKIVTERLVESVAFRKGKPVDKAVSKWVPKEVLDRIYQLQSAKFQALKSYLPNARDILVYIRAQNSAVIGDDPSKILVKCQCPLASDALKSACDAYQLGSLLLAISDTEQFCAKNKNLSLKRFRSWFNAFQDPVLVDFKSIKECCGPECSPLQTKTDSRSSETALYAAPGKSSLDNWSISQQPTHNVFGASGATNTTGGLFGAQAQKIPASNLFGSAQPATKAPEPDLKIFPFSIAKQPVGTSPPIQPASSAFGSAQPVAKSPQPAQTASSCFGSAQPAAKAPQPIATAFSLFGKPPPNEKQHDSCGLAHKGCSWVARMKANQSTFCYLLKDNLTLLDFKSRERLCNWKLDEKL